MPVDFAAIVLFIYYLFIYKIFVAIVFANIWKKNSYGKKCLWISVAIVYLFKTKFPLFKKLLIFFSVV